MSGEHSGESGGRRPGVYATLLVAALGVGVTLGRGLSPASPVDVPAPADPLPAAVEEGPEGPGEGPAASSAYVPAERSDEVLAAFDADTPDSYERAYALSEADPLARAEAALLLHYRYGPQRARLDEAKGLLEPYAGDERPFVARLRGLALLAEDQPEEALAALAEDSPRARLYRAWAQLEQGEVELARRSAELVRGQRPGDRGAALVLLQVGFVADGRLGLEALREAAALAPGHLALHDTLVSAERALGHEARSDSSDANRLSHRADLARAEGRSAEARRLRARARINDEGALSRADGAGFPEFDPGRERVLHGRVLASETPVVGVARSHGALAEHEGVLSRTPETKVPNAFWLASGHQATVADGLVRYRVVPGRRPDLGLMFRAQLPALAATAEAEDWEHMSGYELAFEGKRVQLLRWDRGVAKPMGRSVALDGLSDMTRVEVLVYLVGPQLLVTVYGGQKLELLATLAARDTTYASGAAGLRAGTKQVGGGLELLAVMDTRRVAPGGVGQDEQHGRLYLRERVEDASPFGPRRYAFVPAAELAKLPPSLRRRASGETFEGEPREAVLDLSPPEAEQLRRTSARITAIDGSAPWGLFHPSYREQRGQPPTPSKRGLALDLSYKNPQMVEELLRGYQTLYPEISELIELGRSHGGRPVWALKISAKPRTDEDEPAVLFTGLHHSAELLSTEFTLDVVAGLLEGYGRSPRVTRWLDRLEIYCVPMVNPDGADYFLDGSMWANRKNGYDADADGWLDPFEGVDLNRNYPFGWGREGSRPGSSSPYYRGPAAGSEPEIQAIMALADAQHFAASISFHTLGRAIFVPYLVDRSRNPRPDVADIIARELVAAAPEQRNGRPYVVRPNGYPVSGCDQDWLMFAHGTVALLLEGAYQNPVLAIRTQAVANTRPVWETLLDRVSAGPRISGHVRDEQGAAVEASVSIDELELRAGEVWMSRARDGRFDRLLATGGRYTVRAEAPGYVAVEHELRVGESPVELEFVLSPT